MYINIINYVYVYTYKYSLNVWISTSLLLIKIYSIVTVGLSKNK